MEDTMSEYYDLGSYTRPISTSSSDAQRWFDRGLIWTYAFNHEEAIRCFQKAINHDPECAMAHWGLAYASGPHYNRMWQQLDEVTLASMVSATHAAIAPAVALRGAADPAEQALITAMAARYRAPFPDDNMDEWNDAYAGAMRAVYRDFPDDIDVAALCAEALMTRTPWQLWDLVTGYPADGSSTVEAREILERTLALPEGRKHPGLLHMYIHLMEMSPTPERALSAADRLRHLVPDAGHLLHMPTHIDVLCGDYHTVVASNVVASAADDKYVAREGGINFYTHYRAHNHHFRIYGAMFLGQSKVSLDAADDLVRTISPELLAVKVPPMADRFEGRISMKLHALIRFGRWKEIIETPIPEDQNLYCVTIAMIHYAKGVAYAATGRVAEAEQELVLFESALTRVPETRYLQNNLCIDILQIADAMLRGELEYRKGNVDAAFAHLRQSVALSDGLQYAEPWAWMQPPRHALGALLLEQGLVEEAEAVYRADLGLDGTLPRAHQHPENVWALHGYHECLHRLGKCDLADLIKPRLDLAVARADVPIESSCFCRSS
jgi:tetratricopeptide (TPR) repeat protein